MKCSRGEASPSAATRIRLFADSAGYCHNPDCARHLFENTAKGEPIHFAEMAHIFAASDEGPRANADLSDVDRGSYDNLILLCAICHTKLCGDLPIDLTVMTVEEEVELNFIHSERCLLLTSIGAGAA